MSFDVSSYIVNNITLPPDASFKEAFSVAKRKIQNCNVNVNIDNCRIYKRSIDARKKHDIHFVYSVIVTAAFSKSEKKRLEQAGFTPYFYAVPDVSYGEEQSEGRPLVVGSGPAGMFAALILAENGYRPILIERGGSISERVKSVSIFCEKQILDASTNIQFGAGGAGTFSDGKLVTRINDPLSNYVFNKLVEFGAPEEITYLARPHVGTDILAKVVDNILSEIERLGGSVLYHTKLLNIPDCKQKITQVETNTGVINCGSVILAIGHSARDTYEMLLSKGVNIEAKSFSVGLRIEHSAYDIDRAMYGDMAGHPTLGHGEYNLSYNTKQRGVYTFCMCPGGEVVAAASEEGGVVVNGMSHHSRSGKNSNSAVCCTIFKEDYGNNPRSAIEFQRIIEQKAYVAGGKDYSAPVITVGDFLSDKCSKDPSSILPTYMGGLHTRLASPRSYLPDFVVESIKGAIINFENKISGFANPEAVLTGVETRTSAPIRILRNNDTRLAFGCNNLYPSGEGAGYAGGITSSAIDGVKTALAVMARYQRPHG